MTIAAKIDAAADWGPAIERAARMAALVAVYLYVVGSLAGEVAYDLGRQTRDAVEARSQQLAALSGFLLELADGITLALDFPELWVTPALTPVAAPIALLPPAPSPKRRRAPAARKKAVTPSPRKKAA